MAKLDKGNNFSKFKGICNDRYTSAVFGYTKPHLNLRLTIVFVRPLRTELTRSEEILQLD